MVSFNSDARAWINLSQQGSSLAGTGTWWGFITPSSGTLTTTGTTGSLGAVTVTMTYDNGRVFDINGTRSGLDQIHVSVTSGNATDTLTIVRQ